MAQRYRKCTKNEDGTIDCVAYKPTKSGEKTITATIKAQETPDCKMAIVSEDGDPKDLTELQEYLSKKVRLKCEKRD